MPDEHAIIKNIVIKAMEKFITKDMDLLHLDANERSMTHKFAQYVEESVKESSYSEYSVDCEYNRTGCNPDNWQKKLENLNSELGNISANDDEASTVFPDIIVHIRKDKNSNLLIIEAKKDATRGGNRENIDRKKLKLYKEELSYRYAFFITFPVALLRGKCISDINCEELVVEI